MSLQQPFGSYKGQSQALGQQLQNNNVDLSVIQEDELDGTENSQHPSQDHEMRSVQSELVVSPDKIEVINPRKSKIVPRVTMVYQDQKQGEQSINSGVNSAITAMQVSKFQPSQMNE